VHNKDSTTVPEESLHSTSQVNVWIMHTNKNIAYSRWFEVQSLIVFS